MCEAWRAFHCRSISYSERTKECALSQLDFNDFSLNELTVGDNEANFYIRNDCPPEPLLNAREGRPIVWGRHGVIELTVSPSPPVDDYDRITLFASTDTPIRGDRLPVRPLNVDWLQQTPNATTPAIDPPVLVGGRVK
jgi:hypothetical protein